jgi:hypothetical protein
MKRLHVCKFAVLFAALFSFTILPLASAQPAGYDLLQTPPGGAAIGVTGVSPPTVELEGVPICACTGQTDTIMHRTDAVAGHANLTVVALFLKNSGPVTRNGTAVDVYITVNNSGGVIGQNVLPQPDALPASTGTLTIRADGTFDSSFTVHSDVIIVAKGADVHNPATHIAHMAAPPVTLSANNSIWSTVPPAGYPPECYFPANGFYPGGPVPETAPTGPHQHPVVPSGPPTGNNGARCVSFNPATAAAQQVSGRWKIMVNGGQALFDFGTGQAVAEKTAQFIHHYNMNQSCTLGTPFPNSQQPPFSYMLVGAGTPPTGPATGEQCTSHFDPATAHVIQKSPGNYWTLMVTANGVPDYQLYNFRTKGDADQSLAILQQYGFNFQCEVGGANPPPSFVWIYMRK